MGYKPALAETDALLGRAKAASSVVSPHGSGI
jgi:hypothetical protein